jgi:hypothetical protein
MLLAQGATRPTRNLDLVNDVGIPLGLLAGALIVLAMVVFFMKRWYEGNRKADDSSDLLSQLRDATEDGELTPAEMKMIKAKLAPGLRSVGTDPKNGGDPAKRGKPTYQQRPKQPDTPRSPDDDSDES